MIVYKITNKLNNKCYIGITAKTFRKRYNCRNDWWNAPSVNILLKNAVNKYGDENLIVEVICSAKNREDLNYLENYFITYYNSIAPNGYNLTSGGDSFTHNEESNLKNRLAHLGRPAWNKGKKLSKEHIERSSKTKQERFKSGQLKIWNKGISIGSMSKEAIENSAKGHYKRVGCFDLSGNLIKEYESVKSTKLDGYDASQVSRCCTGSRKSYKDMIWKRI